ncbi:MAG: hypothetical protein ACFE0Q_09205 [Anaerolineae bacterium]
MEIETDQTTPVGSEHKMTLPRRSVEWSEAIVKWTRYDYVQLYDYPTTHNSEVVLEIHKGDMVQVSRRYRREDWCLCQVGHVLGWVFLGDVRFLVQGARAPRPNVTRTPTTQSETDTAPPTNRPNVAHVKQDTVELHTEPIIRQQVLKPEDGEPAHDPDAEQARVQVSDDVPSKKPMIERLINFFKR